MGLCRVIPLGLLFPFTQLLISDAIGSLIIKITTCLGRNIDSDSKYDGHKSRHIVPSFPAFIEIKREKTPDLQQNYADSSIECRWFSLFKHDMHPWQCELSSDYQNS